MTVNLKYSIKVSQKMQQETLEEQQTRATASELARLSLQGIQAINNRDWTYTTPPAREFLNRIAPDFCLLSPSASVLNWEQAVAQWREKSSHWPDLQVVVTHVSSDVRMEEGRASVHIESHVTGAGDSVTFKWLSQRLWRLEEGRWTCYEMSGMRGTESLTGFV